MAWIKTSHDLLDKAEVVEISTRLGIDQDAVVGKLLRIWVWCDKNCYAGVMPGVTPGVIDRMTFCAGFGKAMSAVGWIIFQDDGTAVLPNFEKHNSETAKTRALTAKRAEKFRKKSEDAVTPSVTSGVTPCVMPGVTSETESESSAELQKTKVSQNRTSIGESCSGAALSGSDLLEISGEEVGRASPLADSLFKRSKYTGDDGALLWKIAILVGRGIVPEGLAHDAAEGAKMNAKKNPVGFVRKALAETCSKKGIDLDREIARVKMPRGSPTSRPRQVISESMRALTDGIGSMK